MFSVEAAGASDRIDTIQPAIHPIQREIYSGIIAAVMSAEDQTEFESVAKSSELENGSMLHVSLKDGTEIVLARSNDKIYAIGAYCKHEEWDLSEGTLEETHLTCAGHGAVWDLETGKAEFVEELEPEPLYEIRIEGEEILVSRKPKQIG